jgi:hypothetical protein
MRVSPAETHGKKKAKAKSMRRIHALELEDQSWMPEVMREAGMAYLCFMAGKLGMTERIRPIIEDVLARSGEKEILDLCSGAEVR